MDGPENGSNGSNSGGDLDSIVDQFFDPTAPVGTQNPSDLSSNKNLKRDTTVAPTNSHTINALAEREARLTEKQLDFVTLLHQHWSLHGTLLTGDAAMYTYAIPHDTYNKFIKKPAVLKALSERGIDVPRLLPRAEDPDGNDNWRARMLSPRQLIVANAMMDLQDTRSDKKKLQDLNVSTGTWNSWLKDPVFVKYLQDSTEGLLKNSQHEASLALLDKVRAGDTKAISLYLELTGRFVPESSKAGNANAQMVDFQNLLIRIVEIIADEVDDPNVAARISDRFKMLMTARTVAGELIDPGSSDFSGDGSVRSADGIRLPQVAPARELTPELMKLTGSGSDGGAH